MQPLTPQFFQERRQIIGGSDAAAILGLSPWRTIHDVYAEKVGLTEATGEMNERQEFGLRQEPVLADTYLDRKRRDGEVVTLQEAALQVHAEYPFIGGHVDRLAFNGQPGPIGIVELKTSDGRLYSQWGPPGTDIIPDYYNIQVQHYMLVTELPWADLAVLIGGNDFRIYRIDRHEGIIQVLLEKETAFWNAHVLPEIPPAIDRSPGAGAFLSALFPHDAGSELLADETLDGVVHEYFEARDRLDEANAAAEGLKNEIKALMGDNSVLRGPGYKISWKQPKDRSTVNWKAAFDELRLHCEIADSDVQEIVETSTKVTAQSRRFLPGKLNLHV